MNSLNPLQKNVSHPEGMPQKGASHEQLDLSLQFSWLYTQYSGQVYQKCLSMLTETAFAEDAVQDIFLKIYLNLERFRRDAKFSSWIYAITHNYCIDFLRKQKRRSVQMAGVIEMAAILTEETHYEKYLTTKVAQMSAVMQNIPPDDKTLLEMKYKDEWPIKTIASHLEKSESAVKMQLKRARTRAQKVRTEMAANLAFPKS